MIKKTTVLTKNDTLNAVHLFIKKYWKTGCACPACGRRVKLYKRRLNSSMGYALIILYKLHLQNGFNRYFKMNEAIANLKIPANNVEYAKLHYWGLAIQSSSSPNNKSGASGYWKLTKKGVNFVKGLTTIPSHVLVYNTKVHGFSESHVTIKEILFPNYDYDKLMK